MEEFAHIFESVTDPRRSNATRHNFHEMLMIGLLCVLSGGEGCADMARFGRAKKPFLRQFMTLSHGIPSHDAFSDLFNALDPQGLTEVLQGLVKDWAECLDDTVIAIDGKQLRRSFDNAAKRSGLHLVHAFGAQSRLVLGQVAVDGKSNEITALPRLLDMLRLKGRTVTADAMHTQRRTAERVTAGGGDYVLENLELMRRLALNIARHEPTKDAMRGKLKRAAWNDNFLIDLIRAATKHP